ncbi:MAG TPA: ABC transporter ATP-binding protein, partial [Planctomycetes bacterium]|nr:ABC transporter ATP-binding protein [Planctomycetota bacterium]
MFPFAAFRFLAPFIRIERRAYLLGVILILVTSLLHVLVPWLVGKAIHILEVGEELTRVPEIALAMVGVVLLRGVTSFWTRQTVIG